MTKGKRESQTSTEIFRFAEARIAIENVSHEIDGGRFPAKTVAEQPFEFFCDIFSDGHDVLHATVTIRPHRKGKNAASVDLEHLGNDRWQGDVTLPEPGMWELEIQAWRDVFGTWRRDTAKKLSAGQDISLELKEARKMVEDALEAKGAPKAATRKNLEALLQRLDRNDDTDSTQTLMSEETFQLMREAQVKANLTTYERKIHIWADREAAAFSAWYELFPRSWGKDGAHGTFDDVIDRLAYVKDLGFDVIYFPPIHPIGKTNRKGPNNTLTAGDDDPGSPYAIGSDDGGHTAIEPELGTLDDFDRLVAAAQDHGLEVALDFAIQCSPDHPWIREHPEWFDWRPDGTIKFAENPPKKYEDIVNVHFYRDAIPSLWIELRDVVLFWIEHGVKIFRVDNPHTKPFPFWEWMIGDIHKDHPDVIFLAEAFTRPKVMKRLAKVGYSQSYSYFTWRHTKEELTEYLTELTQEECRHYMRPNFFANTPDINPYFLQASGRAGFRTRMVLAATLAGNYGIYNGFEICEGAPVPGKEEYLDSEKYQLRAWDFDQPGHIKDDIRLINTIRRENAAMRDFTNLNFFTAHDDRVLYYGRMDAATGNYLLFHVLLDPHTPADFGFELPLWKFGLPDDASIEVQDLMHGNRFTWHGVNHRLALHPDARPYAIWRLYPPPGMRT